MKFIVHRTSEYRDIQPCVGAEFEEYKVRSYLGEERIIKNFFVNINTLEELLNFMEKHGRIVLDKNFDGELSLEIYDTWRE